MRAARLLTLTLALATACAVADEGAAGVEDEGRRAVRMKTSRQLREMLGELGIEFDPAASKEELRQLALKEKALERYEALPGKARKKRRLADFGDAQPPEGMDPETWARIMAQMKGDFSYEQNPEKRAILQRLQAKGINFSGASDMDLDALRNLEKSMENLGANLGGNTL